MPLSIQVNAEELAAFLSMKADEIRARLQQEVELLSVSTHAFVIDHAQTHLQGFNLEQFLGKDNRNVRWVKIDQNMWVVEIDDSVRHIEEGHAERFMRWLIEKNPKAKTAKDGSKYAVIPFTNSRLSGPRASAVNQRNPAMSAMIKNELKQRGIPLKKIEKNPDGSVKLGVLHKINPSMPGPQSQFPTLYSAPRTPEMAAKSGLPAHSGIPYLQGTAIMQRMTPQGKAVREAVTFRTISTKHEAEGRWFQKAQQPLHSIQAAHQYAIKQWGDIVKALEDEFKAK